LIDDQAEPLAISGASMLSSTTRADGFVVIEDNSEGYPEGALVTVHLYDLSVPSPSGRGSG
jgi:molybdopterin molybdotransferase